MLEASLRHALQLVFADLSRRVGHRISIAIAIARAAVVRVAAPGAVRGAVQDARFRVDAK